MYSAPAYRTRSRTMATAENPNPILSQHLRQVRTSQDLDNLRRQVQAEINVAEVGLHDSRYASTPRRQNADPLHESSGTHCPPIVRDQRSQVPYNPAFMSHPLRLPYDNINSPSLQWDSGAHNGAQFHNSASGPNARPGVCPNQPQTTHTRVERLHRLPNLEELTIRNPKTERPQNRTTNSAPNIDRPQNRTSNSVPNIRRDFVPNQGPHRRSHNNSVTNDLHYARPHDQSHHSRPTLSDSDHERMDRCYDLYGSDRNRFDGIGDPFHAESPILSQSYSYPEHCNDPHPGGSVVWQFRGPELKPPKFSGKFEDYQEWKLAFKAQVDSYPEELKVPTLREHLDQSSKDFIAYISATQADAYFHCFEALDLRCAGPVAPQHLYTGKILELLSGPQARNLQNLERIYNTLNYTWSKLSQFGYEHYAEPMMLGLSNILFDQSQCAVDKLSAANRLSVPNVLDAIWNQTFG